MCSAIGAAALYDAKAAITAQPANEFKYVMGVLGLSVPTIIDESSDVTSSNTKFFLVDHGWEEVDERFVNSSNIVSAQYVCVCCRFSSAST